jgi:hypothetical protein
MTIEDIEKAKSQIASGVLVCPKCQELISISERSMKPALDKSIARPSKNLNLKMNRGQLIFSTPWRSKATFVFLMGGFSWMVTLGLIWSQVLKSGIHINGVFTNNPAQINQTMGVSIIPGFVLLIIAIIQLVNSTRVAVSHDKVVLSNGPLWNSKAGIYPTSNIDSFSIRRYQNGKVNNQVQFANVVEMRFKSGTTKKLCRAADLAEAIYIEQEIERFLGMTDNPSLDRVAGGDHFD